MPISSYLKEIRALVGTRLIMMPAVAGLVRNSNGDILIQKRSDDGQWTLPAGSMDPGETGRSCVVREVYEETGLSVEPLELAAVFTGPKYIYRYPHGDVVEYTILVYECRVTGGALQCLDGEAEALEFCIPGKVHERVRHYPAALYARLPGDPVLEG